ncbi:MAG: ribosome biogenesis GTP-binding protein YihA/YsxC [Desulfovibrio sp.]
MNRSLELVKTVFEPNQLEVLDAPQVALAGRSNVGKSSLVNCLAGRKSLARISSTPGKTRSLNFYLVKPDDFFLVDLPGYGYAKTSKTERAKWGKLIERYVTGTRMLTCMAVLLDSRLPPQRIDLELVAYLKSMGIPLLAVLTKADKCKQKDLAQRVSEWRDLLGADSVPLPFSSKTGRGRDKLWNLLAESVSPNPGPNEAA